MRAQSTAAARSFERFFTFGHGRDLHHGEAQRLDQPLHPCGRGQEEGLQHIPPQHWFLPPLRRLLHNGKHTGLGQLRVCQISTSILFLFLLPKDRHLGERQGPQLHRLRGGLQWRRVRLAGHRLRRRILCRLCLRLHHRLPRHQAHPHPGVQHLRALHRLLLRAEGGDTLLWLGTAWNRGRHDLGLTSNLHFGYPIILEGK